jgi:polyribonucleotide nucleotidyltransferase
MALFLSVSLTSCREKSEKEKLIEEMKDEGATIKTSDDGDKIKMETEDRKVKIKTDDDGDVKIKEKTENDDN